SGRTRSRWIHVCAKYAVTAIPPVSANRAATNQPGAPSTLSHMASARKALPAPSTASAPSTVRRRCSIGPVPNVRAGPRGPAITAWRRARSLSSSSTSGTSGVCDMSMVDLSDDNGPGEQAGHFRCRNGLVIEPALHLIAAGCAGEGRLGLGFDTLGGNPHVHRTGDGDRRDHHRPARIVVRRVDDQRAVELELLEAELPQEADRGVSGAEVVERHADTEAADHVERAAGDVGIADEVGLGDLEL